MKPANSNKWTGLWFPAGVNFMFAFILIPLALLWTADDHPFLERVTKADWEYVGYTERKPGLQPSGSYALTLESDGKTFILFKQKPLEKGSSVAGLSH